MNRKFYYEVYLCYDYYTEALLFAIHLESVTDMLIIGGCRPEIINYDKTIFLYFIPKSRVIRQVSHILNINIRKSWVPIHWRLFQFLRIEVINLPRSFSQFIISNQILNKRCLKAILNDGIINFRTYFTGSRRTATNYRYRKWKLIVRFENICCNSPHDKISSETNVEMRWPSLFNGLVTQVGSTEKSIIQLGLFGVLWINSK